jgi:hypothetical protein
MAQIRGSLRLDGGLALARTRNILSQEAREVPDPPYVEGLVKLFPAEGVTLLPTVLPIAAGNFWLKGALVGLILALIVILRAYATQPAGGGKPDWVAVCVAVISFLLYACALQVYGPFLEPPERHTMLMTLVTGVWVALVPLLPRKPPANTMSDLHTR